MLIAGIIVFPGRPCPRPLSKLQLQTKNALSRRIPRIQWNHRRRTMDSVKDKKAFAHLTWSFLFIFYRVFKFREIRMDGYPERINFFAKTNETYQFGLLHYQFTTSQKFSKGLSTWFWLSHNLKVHSFMTW